MEQRHSTGTSDLDHVLSLLDGAKISMVICAACELELFDKLATVEGLSAAELASNNNWDVDATERLLNALVSFDLLHKSAEDNKPPLYTNGMGAEYLVRSASPSIWGYSTMVPRYIKNLSKLSSEIKTGGNKNASFPAQVTVHKGTAFEIKQGEDGKDKAKGHGHSGGMSKEALVNRYESMDGMCRPHVDKLVKLVDLSQHQTAVDLGAGSGVVSFALRRAYPNMTITLFEVPPVIELVKEHFMAKQDQALTEKVSLMAGDFMETKLPPADLYVLSKIVHDWREDQVMTILSNVRAALNPGGALLLLELCLNDDKCGPRYAHAGDMLVMSACGGRLRSGAEYKTLLEKANFTCIEVKLTQDWCPYDVIYAKK